MSKNNLIVKKLGYPLWFNILFFLLTIAVPIGLIIMEGMKAPPTPTGVAFKVSFMVSATGILAWVFIKKFIVNKLETKLIAKQVALEHDYSIDNGDSRLIKFMWYKNEEWLSFFNLVTIALYGGFAVVIMLGIASTLIKVRGILLIIMSAYIIAYTVKFMILIIRRDIDV